MTAGDIAHLVDIGLGRDNNEDAALSRYLDDGRVLLIVADGVGGAAAGEVASATAISTLEHEISGMAGTAAVPTLTYAVTAANRAVWERAASDPSLRGMASTSVVALIDGNHAWVTHTGDSRAYLFDGEAIVPLTTDHTVVAELLNTGQITEAQARTHRYRNVITRALGMENVIEVDQPVEVELPSGTVLLLCTDGLTGPVEDVEIEDLCRRGGAAADIAAGLVARAIASGGPDNIGVALYVAP